MKRALLVTGIALAFALGVASRCLSQTVEAFPDATACERVVRPNTRDVYAGLIVCGRVPASSPTVEELAPLLACLGDRAPYGLRRMVGWTWYEVTELVLYPLPADRMVLGYTNFFRKEVYVRAAFPPGVEFTKREVRVHEAAHVLTHAMDDDPILPYCTGIPRMGSEVAP